MMLEAYMQNISLWLPSNGLFESAGDTADILNGDLQRISKDEETSFIAANEQKNLLEK